LSFRDYVKESFATWLEDWSANMYECTALDGLLLAMLIWAIIVYGLGLSASDLVVVDIGGVGFVVCMIAMLVKGAYDGFKKWQRGES